MNDLIVSFVSEEEEQHLKQLTEKDYSPYSRLDGLLQGMKTDVMNSTNDYQDKITSEFENFFTREFYMKFINKAMNGQEQAEFIEYLAGMFGLGS